MSGNFLTFTKRVLPLSNTFVANQAKYLKDYQPVFTGFTFDQSGRHLVDNYQTCALQSLSKFPKLDKFLLEGFARVPKQWTNSLKDFSPEFIHAHFGKCGFYAAPIANALSIPLVVTFHGSDITEKDKFSYNQKHRQKVYQQASKVFASSNFIAKKLLENGCPEDKLFTHYIGVDTEFFKPTGNKAEKPTVLFVGRLIKQKGCQFLLEAMREVEKAIPEVELLIVGDGVEKKALQAQAKNLKKVKFLGSQKQQKIRSLMDEAWVMCAPSVRMQRGNEEGLGMVFLEAQAMGTPVVSFKTGGVIEAVEDGKTGLLVEEKNIKALADSLIQLLRNSNLREAYSRQSIARVKQLFDLETQTRFIEQIYHSLS